MSRLVDAGASLPEARRFLGDADLCTIQVYPKVAGRGFEETALSNPTGCSSCQGRSRRASARW